MTDLPQQDRPLSEQFRIVAKAFATAYGDMSMLENTRTGELAKLIKKHMAESNEKVSHAAADMHVKASDEWFAINRKLADAKEKVEVLRAQKKYIDMQSWERQNADANRRKELGL